MQESIKLRCLQEYKLTNGDFGGNHGDLIAQFQGRNILLLINLSKKLLDVHTRAVGCKQTGSRKRISQVAKKKRKKKKEKKKKKKNQLDSTARL